MADAVLQLLSPYEDNPYGGHAFVPIDDERRADVSIDYHPHRGSAAASAKSRACRARHSCAANRGLLHPPANRRNDYLIDREAQKSKRSFSGVPGVGVAGCRRAGSMGAIQDRTRDTSSPRQGIVKTRRLLMDAAGAVARGTRRRGGSRGARRPRGIHGRAARVEPARTVAMAQKDRTQTVRRHEKRALHALLAVGASLRFSPLPAQTRGACSPSCAQRRRRRVINAARGAPAEGFLSLYTSFPREDVAALNARSRKKYGVKSAPGAPPRRMVFQRTVAGSGRDEVDIVDSNSVAAGAPAPQGLLQPVRSPRHAI